MQLFPTEIMIGPKKKAGIDLAAPKSGALGYAIVTVAKEPSPRAADLNVRP